MAEPELTNHGSETPVEPGDPSDNDARETHFHLGAGEVEAIIDALESGRDQEVRQLVAPLHFADAADLVERLSTEQRRELLETASDILDPDFFTELDVTVREEVVEIVGLDAVAEVIAELETDDAIGIVEELDDHDQRQVLDAIPAADRALIEEGLAYPEYSAGRMMQRDVMTVPQFWSVGETIDFMRDIAEQDEWSLPDAFYDIIVVDPRHVPVGTIALSVLLRHKRPTPVRDIMHERMKLIPASMDQEDVAFLFRQRDLVSAPVVRDDGRLVGVITIDDVVDVIDEEAEDDILRLGGVKEDDLYSATLDTTKSRFSWLFLNLLTAILASLVIGMFQGEIEQVVALAVLMPIVASMGGNAGTQTLTVAVRALATKELTANNAMRQIWKELLVGGINGVVFAVVMGVVAWLWFSSPLLGVVIGLAMIANLIVAGLAGATIPIALERAGVDPAVSSSVFLTTVTDVVGFLVFLGLGGWLLM
ncbi:MAG: magnesium transporter [Alphaproteobacteria bacterium]|nr:magnesium transporter [Alphaproteobacteria bacterium]MBF0251238.1 magnesium transporter [Alphaproteobacteria bacterium]